MRRFALILLVSLAATLPLRAQQHSAFPALTWRSALTQELPLLGHRNWILIVDSAYPLQVAPGIEVFDTHSDQLAIVSEVLSDLQSTPHIRPVVYLDAELPYVPDQEAPGVSDYRAQLTALLDGYEVHHQLHQQLIDQVSKDGVQFHILVLKTRLAVPYTSVFLHLDCRYWTTENERGLREAMSGGHPPAERPRP